MKNKKALSDVVSTVVLIMITLVVIGIVWVAVDSFLKDRLEGSENCLYSFEKIKLNPEYTCYNYSANETLISIVVDELDDLTSIIVAVNYGTESKTFVLDNQTKQFENLLNYPSRDPNITMPRKGQGRTYILTNSIKPDSIKIAPKVGKKQCDVLYEIPQITNCN